MASLLETENNSKVHDHETREEEEEEIFCYALQLGSSSAKCMSLQCTIELGVFNIIGRAGPGAKLSPSDITAQMPTNNPEAPTMVDSILRVLACHSVLNCSVVAADDNMMALCKGYTVFLQCPNLCHKQRCLGVTRQNVTSTYPPVKGINFDLPHVIKHAPSCPSWPWMGTIFFVEYYLGRVVLSNGWIWRVGNGHNSRVYRDPWLGGIGSRYMFFRQGFLNAEATVSELITDSGGWASERVQNSFSQYEAFIILKTPVGGLGVHDRL
ncbi:hypothetical protein FEM48_Zijuj08G0031400 [Ziziphus jujuba var. spinosa]|uniref:Plant methyltransferase dimerisation domain-containing protein n=1 Tax=Ziziphus jujuba var. spinosa TaxID=714518 RepID=A0A978UWM7_ZIZJJ|nr:hypothetical protein FEM48_Zijuj08G0031400 [Ziziphus jujuba var. spinosa]